MIEGIAAEMSISSSDSSPPSSSSLLTTEGRIDTRIGDISDTSSPLIFAALNAENG